MTLKKQLIVYTGDRCRHQELSTCILFFPPLNWRSTFFVQSRSLVHPLLPEEEKILRPRSNWRRFIVLQSYLCDRTVRVSVDGVAFESAPFYIFWTWTNRRTRNRSLQMALCLLGLSARTSISVRRYSPHQTVQQIKSRILRALSGYEDYSNSMGLQVHDGRNSVTYIECTDVCEWNVRDITAALGRATEPWMFSAKSTIRSATNVKRDS